MLEPSCEELKRMYLEEMLPVAQIAKKLGVSTSTVYRMLEKCGVTQRRRRRPQGLTEETERRIVEEYLAGTPPTEIIRRYGVSPGTLYRLLRRYGVEPEKSVQKVRRPLTREEVEEAIRLYMQGESIYSIARKLGRSYSTVYTLIKRYIMELEERI